MGTVAYAIVSRRRGLLLSCLGSGLASNGSSLASNLAGCLSGDTLDDTDCNGLSHITNGETTKWGVVSERFNAHGFGGCKSNNGSISVLDVLGGSLSLLTRAAVDLGENLGELTGDVGSVAIEHWGISGVDLTRVVEDDDLGIEVLSLLGGIVLSITSNHTTANILNRQVLDVETNVVSRPGLREGNVMHLNRLDFSGHVSGGESDVHAWLEDSSLNTSDGYSSDTSDLVHILKGNAERLLSRSLGL